MEAAAIRARLSHPVVDADGHWLEFTPLVRESIQKIGGDKALEGFTRFFDKVAKGIAMSNDERRRRGVGHPGLWASPMKNTRDRATAMLPRLLYERLDELGLDFCVLFPSLGLYILTVDDAEVRSVTCRAYNIFCAEYFAPYADRLTPAALIPMNTPEEAIAELEHVKNQLGLKVVLMSSMIRRPRASRLAISRDVFGLDSEYDYDPVWEKCLELGVSPAFHSAGSGYGMRNSPSSFTYNHIGHFGAAGEAVCKALFLGGVTRRFPSLKFAFLEGGTSWACQLYADLIGHWEKRSLEGLEEVNPANLDLPLFKKLAETYGDPKIAAALAEDDDAALDLGTPRAVSAPAGRDVELDDFAACRIERPEDVRELFVNNFYFGCEADDPLTAWAFQSKYNPLGAQLKTLFGSDIGHFDVPNMADVLPEAYELVEDGLLSDDEFRDFTFANPVRFWGEANPDFFKGTVVEKQAAELLKSE